LLACSLAALAIVIREITAAKRIGARIVGQHSHPSFA
jgi:hypothetical protein